MTPPASTEPIYQVTKEELIKFFDAWMFSTKDPRELETQMATIRARGPVAQHTMPVIRTIDDVYSIVRDLLPKEKWYKFTIARSGAGSEIRISDEGYSECCCDLEPQINAQQQALAKDIGTEEGDGLLKYIVEVRTKSPITNSQKTIVVRNINLNIWKALDEFLPVGVCCSVYSQDPEHDAAIAAQAREDVLDDALRKLFKLKTKEKWGDEFVWWNVIEAAIAELRHGQKQERE